MSYLPDLCLFPYSGVQHILCCVFVLFVFVLCLVYSGVQHILCCVFVLFFLCSLCCQFLRIFCDCPSSCVPYVASFSGSFLIALRLVYAMLPVSPDLFWLPFVLCTLCCQFLRTFFIAVRLVYPMLPVSPDLFWLPFVLCTLCCQFLRTFSDCRSSCVPYVASFSGPFLIALRLVYLMLPVSPDLFVLPVAFLIALSVFSGVYLYITSFRLTYIKGQLS